ncbi:hypothetical protein SAMN04487936_101606 [Halobacillus dabanensis]|uniref:Uncharacterized protein n=1 Tax=Halobacillus dabanensis TaxID=240302 RepID=A0A1I3QA51_HALDA|nr:hypothetical protein [Halobacillus dabanensis]SFJ30479.1 hypothetical protein SAMN04487936_101606 [Halobacillus dabanensis]
MLKKVISLVCLAIVVLVFGMVVTTPSEAAFNSWVSEKHHINCESDGSCLNGESQIRFRSSHFKNAGLFASQELKFEDPHGGEKIVRTLGVFGQLIEMEKSKLWDILN